MSHEPTQTLGSANIVDSGAGHANPTSDSGHGPKTHGEASFSDDDKNTAQTTPNTNSAAVGSANTRYTGNSLPAAPFLATWRREANTKRGIWYWRRGSGDLREFLAGGAFDELPEDLQQRSIENGERQRQQKAKAAAKRAKLTGRI